MLFYKINIGDGIFIIKILLNNKNTYVLEELGRKIDPNNLNKEYERLNTLKESINELYNEFMENLNEKYKEIDVLRKINENTSH